MLALLVVPASSQSAPGAAQDDSLEATTEPPLPCGPVTFPHRAFSFADAVVDYRPGITADTLPPEGVRDPQQALGPPNFDPSTSSFAGHAVTLGSGGQLTLQFLDNVLTADGTATPHSVDRRRWRRRVMGPPYWRWALSTGRCDSQGDTRRSMTGGVLMIRRMVLLVVLSIAVAATNLGTPAPHEASDLVIDAAAQEELVDLAWLAPGRADLDDRYGLTYGIYRPVAKGGVSINGHPGPLSPYDEAFSRDANQTYYQAMAIPDSDDPDLDARTLVVVIGEFADGDSAASGFADVVDLLAQTPDYPQSARPPEVGDEARAFSGEFTAPGRWAHLPGTAIRFPNRPLPR